MGVQEGVLVFRLRMALPLRPWGGLPGRTLTLTWQLGGSPAVSPSGARSSFKPSTGGLNPAVYEVSKDLLSQ